MKKTLYRPLSRFKTLFVLERLRCVCWFQLFTASLLLSSILVSCNSGKKVQIAKLGTSLDSMYMMMTDSVNMLISDSGVTKYRMKAPLWYIYDRDDKKQWYFPRGIVVSSIDTTKENKSYLKADTAIYHISKDEWELIGNVEFFGQNGSRLFTPHLFWDKNTRKVYSNDTTYFLTEGKELRGDKFDAMDDLSNYTIYNNRGVFEYQEKDTITNQNK